jgi:ketosteroid isomerase-like protein
MTDDAFIKTLEQETARQAAMLNGDPGPMINYWADSDDITLFGGWEPFKKGYKPVTDTMHWVGSRFTGADAVDLEHLVIASSGDLAYTAGFERSHVSIDGGLLRDMTLRVTHIYRRIDGDWKLIHRHADFPPPDPRKTSAG